MKDLNKIKKYMDYIGLKNQNNCYAFLYPVSREDSRREFFFTVNFSEDTLEYTGWEDNPHSGSSMCEISKKYKLSEHSVVILCHLREIALGKAKKEYLKMLEEEENKKVEKFLNEKIFGNSVDFILEE